MASVAITPPYWYNYKPLAREIKVTCFQGKHVDIDFTEFLIQGANPTSERVRMGFDDYLFWQPSDNYQLRQTLNQRGFLNIVKPTSDPVHGTFYRNMEYGKIRYIPHSRFQGIDCFRFVITTSWQSSDEFRVMVQVLPAPSLNLYVHRLIGDMTYFKYSAKIVNKTPLPVYYYFIWYEFIPTLTTIDGREEIVATPRVLYSPKSNTTGGVFTITDNGSKTDWVQRFWPDTTVDKKGYIHGTNTIYTQPVGPYPLMVRCVMFDTVTMSLDGHDAYYDNVDELVADTNQNGYGWWRTGPQVIWQNALT